MPWLKEQLKKLGKGERFSDHCAEWLKDHDYVKTHEGYVHAPTYAQFGLKVDAKGIPCWEVDEIETKERRIQKRDEFGKITGEAQVIAEPYMTGKKKWVPKKNYLDYRAYLKQQDGIYRASREALATMPENSLQKTLV